MGINEKSGLDSSYQLFITRWGLPFNIFKLSLKRQGKNYPVCQILIFVKILDSLIQIQGHLVFFSY